MSLSPGDKLGPYLIVAPLGAGGMGEVYRATDTKLDRAVAIKVLPDALAQDPDRLARFAREAKVLASLNHPHIAQIYGIEGHALVMELVGGATLRGPLPLATALEYAIQIAEALEAAHEKGIVHRDLKPRNVMVTPEGVVKVLDFGLAAIGQDPASTANLINSPTLTMQATQAGVIMGTAAYMSPEQASGKPVDKRSDIWSFGVVLFELLSGGRLFDGETTSHTLADVLKGPLDFERLPKDTPRAVRDLLRRCLERDVKMRARDMGDVRIAIRQCLTEPEPAARQQAKPHPALLPWGVAALFAFAAGYAFWSARRTGFAPAQVQRLSIQLPESEPLPANLSGPMFAISPDGTRLVYVSRRGSGATHLSLRRLDQSEIKPLPGTEDGGNPFFSPDSRWLGFAAGGKLKKIPVDGGSPTVISDGVPDPYGIWWNADNTITFTPGFTFGLWRVSADGGKPEVFLKPDAAKNESSYLWPQILPDAILMTVGPDSIATFNEGQIFLAPRGGKAAKRLITGGGMAARYLPTGHLVYGYDGRLLAARLNPAHGKLEGPPIPVMDGVQMDPNNGAAHYAVSDSGTLAYIPGGMMEGRSRVVMAGRDGREEKTFETKLWAAETRLSPDGRRLAFRAIKANDDIHILDLASGTSPRFTFEGGDEQSPLWTPDGARVLYSSANGRPAAIYAKPADGSGAPQLLTKAENARYPSAISPDGKFLIFTEQSTKTGDDLWVMPLEGPSAGQAKPWIRTPFNEDTPAFSPDGRWVAYSSNESGETQIFVARFPEGSVRRQISPSGGSEPLWAANGREIFYRKKGDGEAVGLMTVEVATEPSFSAGAPHMLFEGKYTRYDGASGVSYAVTPDGQHFLLLKPAVPDAPRLIQVVLNWFEELKRRVPEK